MLAVAATNPAPMKNQPLLPAGDPKPMGRRIRAAMQLACIESFEELSEKIGMPRFGPRTVRSVATDGDPRNASRFEIVAIAEATGVPYEFFVTPWEDIAGVVTARTEHGPDKEWAASIEQGLRDVQLQVAQIALTLAAQTASRPGESRRDVP